jgi:hypothetical protein
MEEDFRAIGLLPEDELTESSELSEVDNPNNPRDIPSPDPSTLGGNVDDSGGSIETRARHKAGKQPRPRIAPDDKNDHDTAMDGGGDAGRKGHNAGGYKKGPNYREDREYDEGYETGPDSSHGYSQYTILAKKPGMEKSSSGHYDGGKDPDNAEGLSPTDYHLGMSTNSGKNAKKKKKMESSSVRRASELMSEVEALLHGAQVEEDFDHLQRGFYLLGENAALLADRLTEISEHFEVGHVVDAMESLSHNAIEALDIVEMKVSHEAEKKQSVKNGQWAAEEVDDEDLSVEDIEELFQAMTLDLMDAVEAYDAVLAEMSKKDDDDDDDEDDDDDNGKKESISFKLAQLRERRAAMGNPTGGRR